MKKAIKKRTTTVTRHEFLIERDDLVQLLKRQGCELDLRQAKFSVSVPGGGNWSNTDLVIGDEVDGIEVVVSTTTES